MFNLIQVTELSMGELLMHSTVSWLNPFPSLGKARKDLELTVFGKCLPSWLCSFRSKDEEIKISPKIKATTSFSCNHGLSMLDLHLKVYAEVLDFLIQVKNFHLICLLLLSVLWANLIYSVCHVWKSMIFKQQYSL